MIELVFVVCLVTAPETCEERKLPFTRDVSAHGCVIGAPPRLARWSATHPKWRIARWTCRPEGLSA